MSTRRSLVYIEYKRQTHKLNIYFEMVDGRYYIEDEHCGEVELPENIAEDFAKILGTKYKHLIPKYSIFERWEGKQRKENED